MDDDLHLGLYIIKVLCLIVIAMSAYKLSYGSESYFADVGKADLPHISERSDFMGSGAVEAPVFWNIGSVQETNDLLQAASLAKEPSSEGFQGKSIKKMKDFSSLENFAGAGL